METNGNTNSPLPPVVSEVAQENYENFLSELESKFPSGGFKTDGIVLTPRNRCAEATIMLGKQWMLEDLVEEFNKRMNVNILYAVVSPEGQHYQVLAYSTPYSDTMYIIKIESQQFGVTEAVTIAFYDSIDFMFDDIKGHLQELRLLVDDSDYEVLEQEDARQTYLHFN